MALFPYEKSSCQLSKRHNEKAALPKSVFRQKCLISVIPQAWPSATPKMKELSAYGSLLSDEVSLFF